RFARARSNEVGLTAGLYQEPVAAGMIDAAGLAVPRNTTRTICARSIAWSKAVFTRGSSSSRCFGFFGFELTMKSVWSTPGTSEIVKPLDLSVLIAVAGT